MFKDDSCYTASNVSSVQLQGNKAHSRLTHEVEQEFPGTRALELEKEQRSLLKQLTGIRLHNKENTSTNLWQIKLNNRITTTTYSSL